MDLEELKRHRKVVPKLTAEEVAIQKALKKVKRMIFSRSTTRASLVKESRELLGQLQEYQYEQRHYPPMDNPLIVNHKHHLKKVNKKEHKLLHEFKILKALVDSKLRAMSAKEDLLNEQLLI